MTVQRVTTLGFALLLLGCGRVTYEANEGESPRSSVIGSGSVQTSSASVSDTSNQYLYDLMQVVIIDQQLHLAYGLTNEPAGNCSFQDDEIFLRTLLIEKQKPKSNLSDTSSWCKITISSNTLSKCLTNADIDEMLLQKERLKNFTWDNTRLGFDISNKKNWYCFSRPLFSKDRKIAVMLIRDLCSGLCGSSWTVILTNNNGTWTSNIGERWMH